MAREHPLRRWRKENQIRLATLAIRVGVTPSHLSEIERGLNAPSLRLAAKLSEVTNDVVSLTDFIKQRKPAEAR